MDKLLSDSAKTEISNKVMDILRAYHISNWHSEPYHQNQNPAEWRYRTIKSWTNTLMNRSGAPANCWLLCLIYVCYLLNHIACTALDGKIPLLALTGITPDISIILLFTFYQPVFYATYYQNFPSGSEERAGYWVLNLVLKTCNTLSPIIFWQQILKLDKNHTGPFCILKGYFRCIY